MTETNLLRGAAPGTRAATPPQAAAPAGPAPWRALPVLLVGALLPILDAFIVNVALATLGRTLHASPADLELTVSGYAVAYACGLVAGGRIGDRFGRRRMFLIGMAGFTIASAACGVAPTALTLILFRIIQGLTAALLMPQVLAVIQSAFTGSDRTRALGFFGATAGIASVIGQVVGGALVSADIWGLEWRPVFLVNVPIGLVTLLLAARIVPESRAAQAARVDILGAVTLAAGIGLVLVPLTLGRTSDWAPWVWACLAASVPVLALFFVSQARRERSGRVPLLPPSLLRIPAARRGLLAVLLFMTEVGAVVFCTTIVLQEGHGFTPLHAGLTMAPFALSFLVVSLFVGRLVARYGRWTLVAGAGVLSVGLVLVLVEASSGSGALSTGGLTGPLVLIGAGQAAVMVPLMGLVLSGLPVDRAGLAGGMLSTSQQIGLASGAALVGTLLFAVIGGHPGAAQWRDGTQAFVLACLGLSAVTALLCARLPKGSGRRG